MAAMPGRKGTPVGTLCETQTRLLSPRNPHYRILLIHVPHTEFLGHARLEQVFQVRSPWWTGLLCCARP